LLYQQIIGNGRKAFQDARYETGADEDVRATAGREASATVAWWRYRFMRGGPEMAVGDGEANGSRVC